MQAIRPSTEDEGNGNVFVHLHDECTNQKKGHEKIRSSTPLGKWFLDSVHQAKSG
jgi:hypothetical protein